MRILVKVKHLNIIQLDVEVLVDALQGAADSDVVLEFDDNGVVGEGFKETGARKPSQSYVLICKESKRMDTDLKNSIVSGGEMLAGKR